MSIIRKLCILIVDVVISYMNTAKWELRMGIKMRIQNIVFPKQDMFEYSEMYFRDMNLNDEISAKENLLKKDFEKVLFSLAKGEKIDFSTYFNGFSLDKWKKYTNIGRISLKLLLKGKCKVTLLKHDLVGKRIKTSNLGIYEIEENNPKEITLDYNVDSTSGMLAFAIESLSHEVTIYDGGYETQILETNMSETKIAINICTFKREKYILNNLDILKQTILENENSPLYKKLQVYISDNGKTLPHEKVNSESIHIVPNKNVGGAGGFTRGLVEILHTQEKESFTHVLMMDDDVVIEPESLFRTYMLLKCRKKEYENLSVGGAMLKIDEPYFQVESGASWNGGKLVSNKKNFDVRGLEKCLENEQEEYTEYNAWWYCCVPMSKVRQDNLPLPIFIRGDDVEYGLRNMEELVLLNGICVWHESFENKYSSFLQYYIIRNLLYDNALHFPEYKLSKFLLRLYSVVAREIVYYRYKNIDLIYKGVEDFYKGVGFLQNTDGEQLHKIIMSMGYQSQPVEVPDDYSIGLEHDKTKKMDKKDKIKCCLSLNGYFLPAKSKERKTVSMSRCEAKDFYRQKYILNYDALSKKGFETRRSLPKTFIYLIKLLGITIQSCIIYKYKMKQFAKNAYKVTNVEFWKRYLEL